VRQIPNDQRAFGVCGGGEAIQVVDQAGSVVHMRQSDDRDTVVDCRDQIVRRDALEPRARQGSDANSMHFILEGRVGIVVDLDNGRSVRVRSLGRHTTIGEMGLIAHRVRSATIQAEIASVLYELPVDAYEEIKRQNPALSQALLSYVISVMAERLSFASRVIGVLQR